MRRFESILRNPRNYALLHAKPGTNPPFWQRFIQPMEPGKVIEIKNDMLHDIEMSRLLMKKELERKYFSGDQWTQEQIDRAKNSQRRQVLYYVQNRNSR